MAVRVVVNFWYVTLSRTYHNHDTIYTTQKIKFSLITFVFTFPKDHFDKKLV